MLELFRGNDMNQNYIEYMNVKKKAKRWGKGFGFLGLFTGICISLLLVMAGTEINSGTLALIVFLLAATWFSYAELGKCYAWAWYWVEVNGHLIAMVFGGFVGFLLRLKYHRYGKQLKKQNSK